MTESKSKAPTNPDNPLPLDMVRGESMGRTKGRGTLVPAINATMVIEAYDSNLLGEDTSLDELVKGLRHAMKRSNEGDLTSMENMLVGQAYALQTMFVSLARRAKAQPLQRNFESVIALALKCQAQSRATIDSLVNLKYPRTMVIAKQANVNQGGQQQVNNGTVPEVTSSREVPAQTEQNELLEQSHANIITPRLDPRAAQAPERSHQKVETLGAINRPKVSRRKGQGGT